MFFSNYCECRSNNRPKFRQPSDFQCNVVYNIPCKDCPWNYIGETGRIIITDVTQYCVTTFFNASLTSYPAFSDLENGIIGGEW